MNCSFSVPGLDEEMSCAPSCSKPKPSAQLHAGECAADCRCIRDRAGRTGLQEALVVQYGKAIGEQQASLRTLSQLRQEKLRLL